MIGLGVVAELQRQVAGGDPGLVEAGREVGFRRGQVVGQADVGLVTGMPGGTAEPATVPTPLRSVSISVCLSTASLKALRSARLWPKTLSGRMSKP